MIPHFKIETNNQTIEDDKATAIEVCLTENDAGYIVLTVNDYKSVNYIDLLDNFNQLDISIKRDSGSYTKVFGGHISNLRPRLDISGEMLVCSAWDFGNALNLMHCDTSYGAESANPSLTSIQDIAQDLIKNYVCKTFNGSGSYWSVGWGYIEDVLNSFSITSLESPYFTCKEILNRLCALGSAYAAQNSTVGPHWHLDPAGNVMMKLINADATGTPLYPWTRYWGGSQAASTIEVAKDQLLYDFQDLIEEYANHELLSSTFRKPATDIWCEDGGPTWGQIHCTTSYSPTHFIVGSHSLKIVYSGLPDYGGAFYPSTHNAAWDFTKCGSPKNVPHLNFYVYSTNTDYFGASIYLVKDDPTDGMTDYFATQLSSFITPEANKWIFVSLPIGPYWARDPLLSSGAWIPFGAFVTDAPSVSWSNINCLVIDAASGSGDTSYYDDIHFSGQIMREAKDTSEINSTRKDRQHFQRLDSATDDTLLASNDSGTAALLCYAELLRRARRSIVGKIEIPGNETILPGQTVHIHAAKKPDGTFRSHSWGGNTGDMRVKEVRHRISIDGFKTQLDLTDDLTNSLAFGVPDNYSLLKEYAMALGHAEAKDLKSSGVDVLIPRLSKNY